MVQNGEITVNEFVRKTRPVIDRSEQECKNKVQQNIRDVKMSRPATTMSGGKSSVYDTETICKRRKRMEKIEKACQLLDRKLENPLATNPVSSRSSTTQHLFDNEVIKIVSRTQKALK